MAHALHSELGIITISHRRSDRGASALWELEAMGKFWHYKLDTLVPQGLNNRQVDCCSSLVSIFSLVHFCTSYVVW